MCCVITLTEALWRLFLGFVLYSVNENLICRSRTESLNYLSLRNICLDILPFIPPLVFVYFHLFVLFFPLPFWMRSQVGRGRSDIFNKKDLWTLSDPEMFGILQQLFPRILSLTGPRTFCFIKDVFVIYDMSGSLTNIQKKNLPDLFTWIMLLNYRRHMHG